MSPVDLKRLTPVQIALIVGAVLILIGGIIAFTGGTSSNGVSPIAVSTGSSPSMGAGAGASATGGPVATPSAAAPVDIACGKPTTATSSTAANPASNATACTANSGWLSAAAQDPQTIQVNLGGIVSVDHVTIDWGSGYATKFKVRTATDGSNWHTINSVSNGTGGTQTVTLPAGTQTAWIQLYLQQAVSSSPFSIDQLQVFALPAAGAGAPTAGATTAPGTAIAPGGVTNGAWSGQFSGFGTAAWKSQWGFTNTGQFLLADLSEISTPTAPGGSEIQVHYGAGSSANSCKDCPTVGGAQFYQQLSSMGPEGVAMENSETLDLKYSIKLPAGWDFGEAGKLPGLYGGQIGQESGGNHGSDGWSTRYMFRDHGGSRNAGEIYLYTPTNSGPTGYGVDYFGTWNWTDDGNWHTVEQMVNRQTGTVTVWFDGKEVLNDPDIATGISSIPFSGVFFSTFFGGHDTTWGPKVAENSYFADFSLSTSIQH